MRDNIGVQTVLEAAILTDREHVPLLHTEQCVTCPPCSTSACSPLFDVYPGWDPVRLGVLLANHSTPRSPAEDREVYHVWGRVVAEKYGVYHDRFRIKPDIVSRYARCFG